MAFCSLRCFALAQLTAFLLRPVETTSYFLCLLVSYSAALVSLYPILLRNTKPVTFECQQTRTKSGGKKLIKNTLAFESIRSSTEKGVPRGARKSVCAPVYPPRSRGEKRRKQYTRSHRSRSSTLVVLCWKIKFLRRGNVFQSPLSGRPD